MFHLSYIVMHLFLSIVSRQSIGIKDEISSTQRLHNCKDPNHLHIDRILNSCPAMYTLLPFLCDYSTSLSTMCISPAPQTAEDRLNSAFSYASTPHYKNAKWPHGRSNLQLRSRDASSPFSAPDTQIMPVLSRLPFATRNLP